jgi:AraC-like DNA-binding protein
MYEHEGLGDIFFIMLYGGATMMAMLAGLYLWLRSGNALNSEMESPKGLRCWAAAFLASVAASHVWWSLLGTIWLTDDRLIRNIVAITLDRVTFVPLMMCFLLRMLQNRRRPLWPVAAAMVPFIVVAVVAIVTRNENFEWYVEGYSLLLGLSFIIYYVHAIRRYGRWLHDNFADLEHKELWQSLLLLACILLVYVVYTTNEGALAVEYLAQILTLVIIGFVVWRVETLQILLPETSEETENDREDMLIASLLEQHCEMPKLYLQYDLTITQLAHVIDTNRTYLGTYFAARGETYNAYINRLRIDHFISLFQEAVANGHVINAKQLSAQSGYRSYSTFYNAFKQRTGQTLTQWINNNT